MRLFAVALPDEIQLQKLSIIREETTKYQTVYFLNDETMLVFTGVGKVNAARVLTEIFCQYPEIEVVINFGSCGSIHKMEPLTVVEATAFQYLDVDVTGFNYPMNQLPKEPRIFNFADEWDAIVGTADSFVTVQNYPHFHELEEVDVIDMEGAALAQVCFHWQKKLKAYKVVSDTIFGSKVSAEDWDRYIHKISVILTDLIEKEADYGRTTHPEF